jgi:hypothetical protein
MGRLDKRGAEFRQQSGPSSDSKLNPPSSQRKIDLQQKIKTNEQRERIAAQNAKISRRGMPAVIYSINHPGRHETLQAMLACLRPTPVTVASRLPEEALLARLCQQNRWDNLQASMRLHRHLLAVIPDSENFDAHTLDERYRDVAAAIAGCGSVAEIRSVLNMKP